MPTLIDFSAGVPSASSVRNAGHVGAVRYVSDPRADWMLGKPVHRADADAYRAAGLTLVSNFEYDKGDSKRGWDGGVADARRADELHLAAGGPAGAPIFFSVDWDIQLHEWNSVVVNYFRGVASVIGKDRVGIYGHSRVIAWAVEDDVIGHSSSPGKRWAWQTRAWSNGEMASSAVLYQRVIDTASDPGPVVGGVTVDVNDILADDYGQWRSDIQAVDMTYYDVDWSSRFDFGAPRPLSGLQGVCLHTSEGNPNISAEDLANYQLTSRTGSYNMIVDLDGTRLRENTDDWRVWASGNQGNDILVHLCFTARAEWSREEWLSHEVMLRAGATVVAHWCKTYGWPIRWVNVWGLPGITTHDATRAWGGTTHTDPGPNFPHDVFLGYVREAMAGRPVVPPPNEINIEAHVAASWIGERITEGENVCPDGVGRWARFENGYIYWHPAVRDGHATAIPNHVFETYAENGWEAGPLGYPTHRHKVVADVGDIQAFQGGIIYRRYGEPGYVVHGAIGDKWAADGFENGPMGWPQSNEEPYNDGALQRFQNGILYWSPSSVVAIPKEG